MRTCLRHPRLVISITATLAVLAAACGDQIPLTTPAANGEAEAASSGNSLGALVGDSEFGPILIGSNGLTLYGFTNDTAAASTCFGTCADAWPPVIVGPDWTVSSDLDAGIFATTVRDDGQLQLVAGKWPLYYYVEDLAPGDVTGQTSGDVWFVVGTDGRLITDPPTGGVAAVGAEGSDPPLAPAVAPDGPLRPTSADTEVGTVIVDPSGLSLYGFTQDAEGIPTCLDECAEAWPPLLVEALPNNLNPMVFSVAERADGTLQLRSGDWPLYYFSGDVAPGEINGQGAEGTWFLIDLEGELVQDPATDGDGENDEN